MKRKFFIGGAALLFAAATLFNMSFLTGNNAGDVSLESIAVMAKAQSESKILVGTVHYPEEGDANYEEVKCVCFGSGKVECC